MSHPVLTAVPRRDGERLVFPGPGEEVVVEGDVELLLAVLERCDGTRAIAEVLALAPADGRAAVAEVLAALERRTLIVDRSRAFRRWHRDAAFPNHLTAPDLRGTPPPAWQPPAGGTEVPLDDAAETADVGLTALLAARRSAPPEAFGDGPSAAALRVLVRAANGTMVGGRRSVPSAGALHPLVLHVACRDRAGGLAAGLWWHDAEARRLRRAAGAARDVWAAFALLPDARPLLDRAGALLVLSADVERTAAVYGNRAYRFACVEVGAAMQNVALAAAERHVPARALGGFDDRALAEALGLPPHVLPLLGVACG